MNSFKNLFFILPIILYYLIESIFIGFIVYLIWYFIFQIRFNFALSYHEIVFIIWAIKLSLFDIFKVSDRFTLPQDNQDDNQIKLS
jgi:hypothetical protein